MPSGVRRTFTSRALVSDSSTEDSDVSSGRSTPVDGNSSSSSTKDLYSGGKLNSKQFWMIVSPTKLSDLLGYSFKHGRPWAVARIARVMHSAFSNCGRVAPFRGLLFAALHYKLDRRLLSDFATCALTAGPRVRHVALLEALLIMLSHEELTHEMETLTNYAENHMITKDKALKADPVLAIFLGYIAAHRIRELAKLVESESDTPAELHAISVENQRSKIRQTLKSALCVPNIAGDVFLELARTYSTVDAEFSFDQVLKSYINRNPQHLTGFLFYLEVLNRRTDADGRIRQLAAMRKIIDISPACEVVLDYAKIIISLGGVADLSDVASRLTGYLEHWDRRLCVRGWTLLCSTLVHARKYGQTVDVTTQRDFWWQYHFLPADSYASVDILKALFVVIVVPNGITLDYVRLIRDDTMRREDSRFEVALTMLSHSDSFQHEKLLGLFR